MRLIFLALLTLTCIGCGAATTSSSTADASDVAADATADVSDDAVGLDVPLDATTSGDTAIPDNAAVADSPWKGVLFLNEINAGGSKTPTVATDADWIELYNLGSANLDLTGCKVGGITNGLAGANPIPAGTQVAAGGFLVIYYNHLNLGSPVIDAGIKSNGSMAIWDKDGLQVDAVDWAEGASPAGSTYDRTPDGSATWKTVSPPTPGKPNSK